MVLNSLNLNTLANSIMDHGQIRQKLSEFYQSCSDYSFSDAIIVMQGLAEYACLFCLKFFFETVFPIM